MHMHDAVSISAKKKKDPQKSDTFLMSPLYDTKNMHHIKVY